MKIPNINVEEQLNQWLSYLAVIAYNVKVQIEQPALNNELNELINEIRNKISQPNLLNDYRASQVRNLFKKIKLDPTKYRPSSEALFRRCHKDGYIPFINNIVAICNYCSLKYLIPIGCYDLDKISDNLTIKIGGKGDKFFSLRSTEFMAEGRIIIADEQSAFGSPIVDSIRASVKENSKNVALVYFLPITIEEQFYDETPEFTEELLKKYASPTKVITLLGKNIRK